MKKIGAFALACLLLFGACLAEEYLPKRYPINENGEAVIDDVVFYHEDADIGLNRVFYEIFVGSFSDSDGDGVGDLRGIINRMDYLNDGNPKSGVSLGVEGIWLTPIFESPSYHKYDVTDFYKIDPAFGTMEDLKELIDLCHERNIRIILDLPINHTSTENRWFRNFVNSHLLNNPANAYYDFYSWKTVDAETPAGRHFARWQNGKVMYEANFSDQMPEPDFDNPMVREALLDVALFYLDLCVDGFRFDAAKYIYMGDNKKCVEFWDWYIGELKKVKPEVYTVAEVWDGDGVIDQYIPVTNCFNFTTSQVSGLIAETAKAGNVNRYTAYVDGYLDKIAGLNENALGVLFVSNHDMDRAAGYLTAASGHMKMAANLYLLSPGSPFIYYGEEIALRGSRGGANTDANRRLKMLWGDGDTVENPEGTTYEDKKQTPYSVKDLYSMSDGMYNYYKRLLMIRKANPEIAAGEYTALTLENTKAGGFIAELDGQKVAVFHNTSGARAEIDLSCVTDAEFSVISAFIGMGQAQLDGHILILDPQTSVVLR